MNMVACVGTAFRAVSGARLGVVALATLLSAACTGNIAAESEPGQDGPGVGPDTNLPEVVEPVACDMGVPQGGHSPLRRLSNVEYVNALRALTDNPTFSPQLVTDGAQAVTEADARVFAKAATDALTAPLHDCGADVSADCARDFVEDFAARAFRRPLDVEESAWLADLYANVQSEFGATDALDVVTRVVLQSPQFLYVNEVGASSDGLPAGIYKLSGFEVASRLSLFFWDSTPDELLLAAAADGVLDTPEGIRMQAERLIDDERFSQTLAGVAAHWFELDGGRLHFSLEEAEKDDVVFPELTDTLRPAMRTAFEAFFERVFASSDGALQALLTSRDAFVNPELAALYGVPAPSEDGFAWTQLPEGERAGLLTRAAFLSTYAPKAETSPIRRGVFVLEQVLCSPLGSPPPDVDDTPIESSEDNPETMRELTSVRTQGGTCQGCHDRINNLGFAFEMYDGIGALQTRERTSGLPVDSSGALKGTDVDAQIENAIALSERLVQSQQVAQCLTNRWFHEALARSPGALDHCTEQKVTAMLEEGESLREVVLALVTSDAFRFRSAVPEVSP